MTKVKIAPLLAICYLLFISIFALDVFSEGYSLIELGVALFMHLVPSLFVLLGVGLGYWRNQVAALYFAALAIGFTLFFQTYRDIITLLIISLPLTIIAGLYFKSISFNAKWH